MQALVVVKVPSLTERVSPVRFNRVPDTAKLVYPEMSMVLVDQIPAVTKAGPVHAEESNPVPPLVVPMAVAFQVPVPMVPKVVMEVVPVLASKAMVPRPRDVLPVEATKLVEVPVQ